MRPQYIRERAHPQGFYLVRCIYKDAAKREAITRLVDVLCERMASSAEWTSMNEGGRVCS
jgi:hypothetical protein